MALEPNCPSSATPAIVVGLDCEEFLGPTDYFQSFLSSSLYPLSQEEVTACNDSVHVFLEVFEKYDPLSFWTEHRARYPEIFQINLHTLGYVATSAFQESVFSTAGTTLTKQRSRLYENPQLLDAVVSLKHSSALRLLKTRTSESALLEKARKTTTKCINDYLLKIKFHTTPTPYSNHTESYSIGTQSCANIKNTTQLRIKIVPLEHHSDTRSTEVCLYLHNTEQSLLTYY